MVALTTCAILQSGVFGLLIYVLERLASYTPEHFIISTKLELKLLSEVSVSPLIFDLEDVCSYFFANLAL